MINDVDGARSGTASVVVVVTVEVVSKPAPSTSFIMSAITHILEHYSSKGLPMPPYVTIFVT